MSLLDCLELVHSSPGRRRYRLRSSGPIDWPALRARLNAAFSGQSVTWRLNAAAGSVLIRDQPAGGGLHEEASAVEASLRRAHQSLLAALADLGIEPPAPEPVIRIHTRRIRTVRRAPLRGLMGALIRSLINGLSSALTLALLLAAGLLFLAGLLGMMIPFTPGSALLLLAYTLIELAFLLRRPFVNAHGA